MIVLIIVQGVAGVFNIIIEIQILIVYQMVDYRVIWYTIVVLQRFFNIDFCFIINGYKRKLCLEWCIVVLEGFEIFREWFSLFLRGTYECCVIRYFIVQRIELGGNRIRQLERLGYFCKLDLFIGVRKLYDERISFML